MQESAKMVTEMVEAGVVLTIRRDRAVALAALLGQFGNEVDTQGLYGMLMSVLGERTTRQSDAYREQIRKTQEGILFRAARIRQNPHGH